MRRAAFRLRAQRDGGGDDAPALGSLPLDALGLATRAASENDAARLAGLSPNELSLANAILAGLVLGTLGIFAGSAVALDTTTLPFLVVPALAAALFARLTSLTIACACGLAIGMAESLIEYASTKAWFPTMRRPGPASRSCSSSRSSWRRCSARRVAADARRACRAAPPRRPRPKHAGKLAIPSTLLCAIACSSCCRSISARR